MKGSSELGILHDGDLETGRRRSSGGRTRQPIDMSSDEEEDNTHVKVGRGRTDPEFFTHFFKRPVSRFPRRPV